MIRGYLNTVGPVRLLTEDEEVSLWHRYKQQDDSEARAQLIRAYQPLVLKLLAGFSIPDQLGMDLLQEGTVGLIEAVEHYDPQQGVKFCIYARYRIRGRIINLLARYSSTQRSEILSGDEYLLGVDRPSDAYPEPEGAIEHQELQSQVQQAFFRLPVKERQAVQATYVEGLSSRSAADRLSVSLSHFYKLQKKAIRRMRGMMAKFIADSRRA